MKSKNSPIKIFITDTAGVLLIVAAALTGWLPGPGGVPLFFAGLGLLSINHEWPARILAYCKRHGSAVIDKIFVDHPVIKALYDIAGFALVGGAVYLLFNVTQNIVRSLAIVLAFLGLTLFLINRKRLRRLSAWAKRK